jgi:hypothetical protein
MRIARWFLCGMLPAGCSSAGIAPTGVPSSPPTPPANASPTAKPQLTDDQLRSSYLNAVRPFNEFTCRFLSVHGTSTDMNVWMDFAVAYSSQIRAFADRIDSTDWNPKTRDEARQLTDALAAQDVGYRYAAKQQDPDAFWAALDATDALDFEVTQAATILRRALGADSVPPC